MARAFLTAEWRSLLMLQFEVDPAVLAPYVPPGTELDTWEGRTFMSLVGFRFLRTRVLGLPVPFHQDFPEVNLRFYVKRTCGGEVRRGVVFVRELVPKPAVAWAARAFYGENYLAVPMSCPGEAEYAWTWRGRPCRMRGIPQREWRLPGEGTQEAFVSEHYWGYGMSCCKNTLNNLRIYQNTFEYRVEHPRCRVRPVREAGVEGDLAGLYPEPLRAALGKGPVSAFLAEGSGIRFRWENRRWCRDGGRQGKMAKEGRRLRAVHTHRTAMLLCVLTMSVGCDSASPQRMAPKPSMPVPSTQSEDRISDVDEWMAHYYLHPEPGRLAAALRKLHDDKTLDNQNAVPPLVAFFSHVLRANPDLTRTIVGDTPFLSETERGVLFSALWLADTAESKEQLRLLGEHDSRHLGVLQKSPPSLLEDQRSDPGMLDMFWGSFFATGDLRYVDKVIESLKFSSEKTDLQKILSYGAARWSIRSNCRQHKAVLEHCRKRAQHGSDPLAEELSRIVEEAAKGRASDQSVETEKP